MITNTIIFVVISIISGINGNIATIKRIGDRTSVETVSPAPNYWMQGDTIEITTTRISSDDTVIIKNDTTIIRWVEFRYSPNQ